MFDHWDGEVADPNSSSTTVTMDADQTVTAHFSVIPSGFLVDNDFDASVDSDDLRTNSSYQDWYESYGGYPTLLSLNEDNIGGNSTKKARIEGSNLDNVYLTQEFGTPQSGTFEVEWDIFVDSIAVSPYDPDRAVWMFIGDDTRSGLPNYYLSEIFACMAFYKDGGGGTGLMDLVAFGQGDTWAEFTTVSAGLNLKQWYTIKVACDLDANSYDIYVDDVYQATIISWLVKDNLTHISFASKHYSRGTFFVDNVSEPSVSPPFTMTFAGKPNSVDVPDEFCLYKAYPNPFNPMVNIDFSLPVATDVKLEIYNMLGQKIATLVNRTLEPGVYSYKWDGSGLASGVYFYRIEAGIYTKVNKMVLMK